MGLVSADKGGGRRDLRLDIVKGIAALVVILHHTLDRPAYAAIGAPLYMLEVVEVFMVLAGYNSARAMARRGVTTLAAAYQGPALARSLLRLLPAYLVVWLVQALLHEPGAPRAEYLIGLLTGGWGWGGYFVPVIVTHTLVFPALYVFARRWPKLLLPVAFVLDLGYELAGYALGLPEPWHQRLYLRYLFVVALGAWLATARPAGWKIVVLAQLSLALWIFPLEYLGLQVPLNMAWASRAAPAAGWALGVVAMGLVTLPHQSRALFWRVLAELGRASYHIFLLQGVYFWHFFSREPGTRQYAQAVVLAIFLSFLGWLFYRAEEWLRGLRRPLAARAPRPRLPLAARPVYFEEPQPRRRSARGAEEPARPPGSSAGEP